MMQNVRFAFVWCCHSIFLFSFIHATIVFQLKKFIFPNGEYLFIIVDVVRLIIYINTIFYRFLVFDQHFIVRFVENDINGQIGNNHFSSLMNTFLHLDYQKKKKKFKWTNFILNYKRNKLEIIELRGVHSNFRLHISSHRCSLLIKYYTLNRLCDLAIFRNENFWSNQNLFRSDGNCLTNKNSCTQTHLQAPLPPSSHCQRSSIYHSTINMHSGRHCLCLIIFA